MKRLWRWWKSNPKTKTVIVGVVGTGVGLAAQGMFGPQAAAVAGAVGALYGLFVKRPQDSAQEAKVEEALESSDRIGKEAEG